MFDKIKFSQILKDINNTYPTMTDFAKKADFDRTYISKYINLKLNNPPSPKILDKLAQASNDVADYLQLMSICGYLEKEPAFTNFYTIIFKKMRPELLELGFSNDEINKIFKELSSYSDHPDIHDKKISDILVKYPQLEEIFTDFMIEENNFLDSYLDKDSLKNSPFSLCPIVGKIAAGQPILAEEYIEGYLPVDPNVYGMSTADDLFYLRVSGQSMNMKVKNGDYALIHKQDYADDGDIIVAIVNSDDEATLKRYRKLNDQFVLLEPMSTDPTIEAITVDLKTTPFQIIGKAIGQFGKF